MRRRLALLVSLFALTVAPAASAQVIGVLRWQTQPFCNVVTLTVAQQGGLFTLSGTDDLCGTGLALITGTAVVNGASVAMGMTVALPSGAGAPDGVDRHRDGLGSVAGRRRAIRRIRVPCGRRHGRIAAPGSGLGGHHCEHRAFSDDLLGHGFGLDGRAR